MFFLIICYFHSTGVCTQVKADSSNELIFVNQTASLTVYILAERSSQLLGVTRGRIPAPSA